MDFVIFAIYCLFLCPSAESRALHRSLPARGLPPSTLSSPRNITAPSVPHEWEKRDDPRYVFMHFILGNTYSYTIDDWKDDIQQIGSGGVDAIALNLGSEPWQVTQIQNAYAAASQSGTSVKLFISADFTAFPCDANAAVNVFQQFAGNPSQFKVQGRPVVSSYAGDCLGNAGWRQIKDQTGGYLMPFIPGLEGQFQNWAFLDSWLCWGCAWPQKDSGQSISDDEYYLGQLNSIKLASSVSPWMFAHYGYKNFYQRGDDWLIVSRWEKLIGLRDRIPMLEMITWNDFGESDYFGEVKGSQPPGTTWADGFSHLPFFDLSKYYLTAYKTGNYPPINEDIIYYWARPHPAQANALADALPRPSGYDFAEDYLWAVVFATQSGTVTLTCGDSTETFQVKSGVNKLKIPLSPGTVTVSLSRDGRTLINQTAANFTYNAAPQLYNYNVHIGTGRVNSDTQSPTYPSPANPSSSSSSLVPTSTVSSPVTTTSTLPSSQTIASSPTHPPIMTITAYYPPTSTSIAPPLPSIVLPDTSWLYKGCFPDYSPRTLPDLFTRDEAQSLHKCIATCKAAGYTIAGVEFGVECFCANGIRQGIEKVGEGECNMACAGAANETCGGVNRINVYSLGSTASKVAPSSASAKPPQKSLAAYSASASTTSPVRQAFTYYGCIEQEATSSRLLAGARLSRPDMTPKMCQIFCAGYTFAGLQNGQECHCGHTLANNGTASSSVCSMPCAGDSSNTCGGHESLSVYTTSGTSYPSHAVGSSNPLPIATFFLFLFLTSCYHLRAYP